MEESRKPMSQMELKETISKYRTKFNFGEDVFSLVSDDFLFGLTKEEVERYLKKGFDLTQMRVISKCFRNGYSDKAIGVVSKEGFNGQQMAVALEFLEKGISIEHIEEVMEKEKAPYVMRAAYQRILEKVDQVQPDSAVEPEYVNALLEQIKSVVSKIEFQEKRYDALNEKLTIFESTKKEEEIRDGLVKSLEEKDQLINNQQDLLNQANATIARLRNDFDGKEKELKTMKKEWDDKKAQNKIQNEQASVRTLNPENNETRTYAQTDGSAQKQVTPNAPISYVYGIPTFYQAAYVDGSGKVVQTPPIEVEGKKSSGVISLLSRIGIKKKSRQDIVKLVAGGELSTEQLVQIRIAIEKELTEKQLVRLIHSKVSASHMKEIIEIAVLENGLDD
jgi:hypothetical protein